MDYFIVGSLSFLTGLCLNFFSAGDESPQEDEDITQDHLASIEKLQEEVSNLRAVITQKEATIETLLAHIAKTDTQGTEESEDDQGNDEQNDEQDIFTELFNMSTLSEEEVLDLGRNLATPPDPLYTRAGGGYATMADLDRRREEYQTYQNKRLTKLEEQLIMRIFYQVVGMTYINAREFATAKGYVLQDMKQPSDNYSSTTIGVTLRSEDNIMTDDSIVDAVVNVGGGVFPVRG